MVTYGDDRLTQLRNSEQRRPALPLRPPDQHVAGRQVPHPELGHVVLPELQTDVPLLAPRRPRQLRVVRRRIRRSSQTGDPGERTLVVAIVARLPLGLAGTCSAWVRAARIARAAMARVRVRAARVPRTRGAVARGRRDSTRPTTGGCSSSRCEVGLHDGSSAGLVVALAEGIRGAVVPAKSGLWAARGGVLCSGFGPNSTSWPLPQAKTLTESKIGHVGQFVAGILRGCVTPTPFAHL
jgi:hypothetical protein